MGGHETEVRPGFSMVNLVPAQVMDEYVRETIRVDMLARKVLGSPVYRRFFAAAPGLPELMVLGQDHGPRGGADGLAAPSEVRPHRRGRARHRPRPRLPARARSSPPTRCRWGPSGTTRGGSSPCCAIPKRPPSPSWPCPRRWRWWRRSSSIAWRATSSASRPRAFILNGCHERRFTGAQETEILRRVTEDEDGRLAPGVTLQAALAAGRRHIRRRKLTQFYLKRLKQAVDVPVVPLPLLFTDRIDETALETLAERIEAA